MSTTSKVWDTLGIFATVAVSLPAFMQNEKGHEGSADSPGNLDIEDLINQQVIVRLNSYFPLRLVLLIACALSIEPKTICDLLQGCGKTYEQLEVTCDDMPPIKCAFLRACTWRLASL